MSKRVASVGSAREAEAVQMGFSVNAHRERDGVKDMVSRIEDRLAIKSKPNYNQQDTNRLALPAPIDYADRDSNFTFAPNSPQQDA